MRAEQPLHIGTNLSQLAARRLSADSKFLCGREQACSGGGEPALLSTAPSTQQPTPPMPAAPERNKIAGDKRRFHTCRCEQSQVGAGSRHHCQRTICTRQIIVTRPTLRRYIQLQAALLRLSIELHLTPQVAVAASCVCRERRGGNVSYCGERNCFCHAAH